MPWPGRLVDAVGPSVEQLAISDSRRAFADAPPENAAILVTFSSITKRQTMSKVVSMPGSSFLPGFAILHGHPTQPRRKRRRRNYQCDTLTRTCRCVSEDKRELAGTGVPPGLQSQCQADIEVARLWSVPNSTASLTNMNWTRPAVPFALVAILAW